MKWGSPLISTVAVVTYSSFKWHFYPIRSESFIWPCYNPKITLENSISWTPVAEQINICGTKGLHYAFVGQFVCASVSALEVTITQQYACCKCTDTFTHVQTTIEVVCQGQSRVTTCRQPDATRIADTCGWYWVLPSLNASSLRHCCRQTFLNSLSCT